MRKIVASFVTIIFLLISRRLVRKTMRPAQLFYFLCIYIENLIIGYGYLFSHLFHHSL